MHSCLRIKKCVKANTLKYLETWSIAENIYIFFFLGVLFLTYFREHHLIFSVICFTAFYLNYVFNLGSGK